MSNLILTTFDWVPDDRIGYVRDLRVRWALEEAQLSYRVETTPCRERGDQHFTRQPFGQVPWLRDDDLILFESGAILFYLAERSKTLMPTDPRARITALQWVFAALNSVEKASHPWIVLHFLGKAGDDPAFTVCEDLMHARLRQLEPVLPIDEWFVGPFSIADILMADVLRLIDLFDGLADHPAARRYVERATARPAFGRAFNDQLAHFTKTA